MSDIKVYTPWVDGTYRCKCMPTFLLIVEGENATLRGFGIKEGSEDSKATWKYGEMGEANDAVAKATGKKNNDVQILMWRGMLEAKGVLSEDGEKMTFWSGIGNQLDAYELMSEEEIEEFNNYGGPADAPPNHYKIQPENQGKFLFITGAPGLGKSTTGFLLSKMADYVYYEADCFMRGANPYLPPDTKEPSIDAMKQKPLKGITQERFDAVSQGTEDFMSWIEGKEHDIKNVEIFLSAMCEDIVKERKRMGGDWAVAFAVPSRHLRNMMKIQLGQDVIFVVLRMSNEDQFERIKLRHGEEDEALSKMLIKAQGICEPATDDEENAIDLLVTKEMSREDIVQQILNMIE